MWLLAGSSSSKTLQQLSVTTGQISDIVPASKSSVSIAQLSSGIIGVGLATDATGALELRNGSSGVLIATVPIGTPVRDVTAGFDGQTFYVLNGNATSSSVTLVNAQSAKASVSVPVPLDTIAVAVDPLGQQIYALGSGGAVRVISVATGSVTAKEDGVDGTGRGGVEVTLRGANGLGDHVTGTVRLLLPVGDAR